MQAHKYLRQKTLPENPAASVSKSPPTWAPRTADSKCFVLHSGRRQRHSYMGPTQKIHCPSSLVFCQALPEKEKYLWELAVSQLLCNAARRALGGCPDSQHLSAWAFLLTEVGATFSSGAAAIVINLDSGNLSRQKKTLQPQIGKPVSCQCTGAKLHGQAKPLYPGAHHLGLQGPQAVWHAVPSHCAHGAGETQVSLRMCFDTMFVPAGKLYQAGDGI